MPLWSVSSNNSNLTQLIALNSHTYTQNMSGKRIKTKHFMLIQYNINNDDDDNMIIIIMILNIEEKSLASFLEEVEAWSSFADFATLERRIHKWALIIFSSRILILFSFIRFFGILWYVYLIFEKELDVICNMYILYTYYIFIYSYMHTIYITKWVHASMAPSSSMIYTYDNYYYKHRVYINISILVAARIHR